MFIICSQKLKYKKYSIESIECVFASKNSLGNKSQSSPKQTLRLACTWFCSSVQMWRDHLLVPSVGLLVSPQVFSPSDHSVSVALFSWWLFLCVFGSSFPLQQVFSLHVFLFVFFLLFFYPLQHCL